ncbi:MAG: hypothetical protein QF893_24660 [Alphaproteobacteria bacterium]|nr:hypothetical protein [Alphaproteobacteria bacterium]
MADSSDHHEIVLKTMTEVEAMVRQQIQKRALANPGTVRSQIVDIEIEQVRATLERLVDAFEDEGELGGADLVRSLIDEWLPVLSRELRSQH